MKIDESTGLPELPEGYFWRVKRDRVEIRQSLPDSEWEPFRGMLHWGDSNRTPGCRTETRTVTKTLEEATGRGMWRNRVRSREYEVEEVRYVGRSAEIVAHGTPKTGPQMYRGDDGVLYTQPQMETITRSNLLVQCEGAMEKFEALKLYGDYPPKKLEAL